RPCRNSTTTYSICSISAHSTATFAGSTRAISMNVTLVELPTVTSGESSLRCPTQGGLLPNHQQNSSVPWKRCFRFLNSSRKEKTHDCDSIPAPRIHAVLDGSRRQRALRLHGPANRRVGPEAPWVRGSPLTSAARRISLCLVSPSHKAWTPNARYPGTALRPS